MERSGAHLDWPMANRMHSYFLELEPMPRCRASAETDKKPNRRARPFRPGNYAWKQSPVCRCRRSQISFRLSVPRVFSRYSRNVPSRTCLPAWFVSQKIKKAANAAPKILYALFARIASAIFTTLLAMRADAASINRPSSAAAPLP